jgi:hypothetical protein
MSSSVLYPAAAGELSPRHKSLVLATWRNSMVVVIRSAALFETIKQLHSAPVGSATSIKGRWCLCP